MTCFGVDLSRLARIRNRGGAEPEGHEFRLNGFEDITIIEGDTQLWEGVLGYRGIGFEGTMVLRQVGGDAGGVGVTTTGHAGDIVNEELGLDWDPQLDWGTVVPLDVEVEGITVGGYEFVFEVIVGAETLFTSTPFAVTVEAPPLIINFGTKMDGVFDTLLNDAAHDEVGVMSPLLYAGEVDFVGTIGVRKVGGDSGDVNFKAVNTDTFDQLTLPHPWTFTATPHNVNDPTETLHGILFSGDTIGSFEYELYVVDGDNNEVYSTPPFTVNVHEFETDVVASQRIAIGQTEEAADYIHYRGPGFTGEVTMFEWFVATASTGISMHFDGVMADAREETLEITVPAASDWTNVPTIPLRLTGNNNSVHDLSYDLTMGHPEQAFPLLNSLTSLQILVGNPLFDGTFNDISINEDETELLAGSINYRGLALDGILSVAITSGGASGVTVSGEVEGVAVNLLTTGVPFSVGATTGTTTHELLTHIFDGDLTVHGLSEGNYALTFEVYEAATDSTYTAGSFNVSVARVESHDFHMDNLPPLHTSVNTSFSFERVLEYTGTGFTGTMELRTISSEGAGVTVTKWNPDTAMDESGPWPVAFAAGDNLTEDVRFTFTTDTDVGAFKMQLVMVSSDMEEYPLDPFTFSIHDVRFPDLPAELELDVDDVHRMTATIEHRGPALTGTLTALDGRSLGTAETGIEYYFGGENDDARFNPRPFSWTASADWEPVYTGGIEVRINEAGEYIFQYSVNWEKWPDGGTTSLISPHVDINVEAPPPVPVGHHFLVNVPQNATIPVGEVLELEDLYINYHGEGFEGTLELEQVSGPTDGAVVYQRNDSSQMNLLTNPINGDFPASLDWGEDIELEWDFEGVAGGEYEFQIVFKEGSTVLYTSHIFKITATAHEVTYETDPALLWGTTSGTNLDGMRSYNGVGLPNLAPTHFLDVVDSYDLEDQLKSSMSLSIERTGSLTNHGDYLIVGGLVTTPPDYSVKVFGVAKIDKHTKEVEFSAYGLPPGTSCEVVATYNDLQEDMSLTVLKQTAGGVDEYVVYAHDTVGMTWEMYTAEMDVHWAVPVGGARYALIGETETHIVEYDKNGLGVHKVSEHDWGADLQREAPDWEPRFSAIVDGHLYLQIQTSIGVIDLADYTLLWSHDLDWGGDVVIADQCMVHGASGDLVALVTTSDGDLLFNRYDRTTGSVTSATEVDANMGAPRTYGIVGDFAYAWEEASPFSGGGGVVGVDLSTTDTEVFRIEFGDVDGLNTEGLRSCRPFVDAEGKLVVPYFKIDPSDHSVVYSSSDSTNGLSTRGNHAAFDDGGVYWIHWTGVGMDTGEYVVHFARFVEGEGDGGPYSAI